MGNGEICDNNALIEIGFFFFLLKIDVLIHRIFCLWKNCVAKSIECTRLFNLLFLSNITRITLYGFKNVKS